MDKWVNMQNCDFFNNFSVTYIGKGFFKLSEKPQKKQSDQQN